MKGFIFLLAFCMSSEVAFATDVVTATVVSVIDGNTIEIQTDDDAVRRVVIADIDCPELTQEFGPEARRFVERRILRKQVTVKIVGKDRKGNYLAIVMIRDRDLRIQLLQEGLAWTSENDPVAELESVRISAQRLNRGLWKSEKPTAPWTYRREQSMLQPKSSS